MQSDLKPLLAVLLAALCATAAAESTSDALTRIEAETLLLKAREKQLDVQSSILTKQNEIALKQRGGDAIAQVSRDGEPVVRGIEGLGGAMYATLQLSDGSMMDVKAGDVLPNGMRVSAVRANEVTVRARGGKEVRLSRQTAAPGSAQAVYMIGAAPMPPLPPLPQSAPRGPAK